VSLAPRPSAGIPGGCRTGLDRRPPRGPRRGPLAVLAGIAATDAICGLSLGKWSRGQDHTQAADLLGEVALRDTTLPTKLRRLPADKDAAQYSPNLITVEKAKSMVRQASALIAEADAH
jgi:hypothetical protein